MDRRILIVLALSAFCGSGALAQGYPQGAGNARASIAYPQGYQPVAQAIDEPDFEALDDGTPVRPSAAAPSSYQSQGQQTYQASVPQGPILSPDDPRYGRPAGAPPIGVSRDRGPGFIYPDEAARTPPGSVPVQQDVASRPSADVGPGAGKSTVMMLPEEDQPETDAPKELPPNLRRQEVSFPTKEPAGTIVVDTANTHLYYILGHGRAIRYGIRVGRDGFRWSGVQKITRKVEWPDWHPPAEMIERQPYLPRFMAGGPGNPLGARALYLGSTVYRIHGTNQPSTIGKTVSSGCFGLLNQDVEDLFERAKVGTRVVVLPGNPNATPVASAAPVSLSASPNAVAQGIPGQATPGSAAAPLPPPVSVKR